MADGDTTTTTTTTETAPDFAASLPEPIRAHPALTGVKDAASFTSILDGHLARSKPLAEQLPKDIAGEAAFKDLKSWDDVAKSYLNAQKMLGVPRDQLLRLPTDDKPESWAPIYAKLGRPEKADGYKLTAPQGVTLEKEFTEPVFAKAHELGMSQKQLEGLYGTLREMGVKAQQAQAAKIQQEVDAATAALKTEFGAAFEERVNIAESAIDTLDQLAGLKGELRKAVDANPLRNSPAMIKALAHIGAMFKEDGKLVGKAAGTEGMKSPMEAKQEIASLQQDKNFMAAYTDRRHTGHKDAVERMRGLYELASPTVAA